MKDIADHLFDILENSVKAGATEVKITLGIQDSFFFCKIEDNGMGIKEINVTDPFVTSRKTRKVGLGLPLLKRAAETTGGFLKIYNSEKEGVILEFKIDISHIDAKPFGDIARTFVAIKRYLFLVLERLEKLSIILRCNRKRFEILFMVQ
jgi:K+-sensing histidine kinase KdpD